MASSPKKIIWSSSSWIIYGRSIAMQDWNPTSDINRMRYCSCDWSTLKVVRQWHYKSHRLKPLGMEASNSAFTTPLPHIILHKIIPINLMYSGTQILRKHWYHICTLYRQITWVLVLKSYRERKKTPSIDNNTWQTCRFETWVLHVKTWPDT